MITIREYAKAAGISVQAVYKRLPKDLASYVKVVDGKKMLDESALNTLKHHSTYAKPVDNNTIKEPQGQNSSHSTDDATTIKQIDNQLTTEEATLQALQKTLETLQEQLAVKDRQIETLTQALLTAQENEKAAQVLHAGTMQRELIETAKDEKPAKGIRGLFKRFKH